MMVRRGYGCIIVYLDDFLVIGSTLAGCQEVFDCLIQLLQDLLGFDISWWKVVPLTQVLIFLGVLIDTVGQFLALPNGKLVELQIFVHQFLYRRRASKRELQVLAGKLNWACRVVFGGRTFLRCILDTISGLQSLSDRFRFTCEFYANLSWWADFLSVFNGKRMFLDNIPFVDVETDACFEAAGGFFQGDWFCYHFGGESAALAGLHINHSGSTTAVAIVKKGTTRRPIVMPYLHRLFWLPAIYNFRITAHHVPGKENIIADPISHLHSPCYLFLACTQLFNFLPFTLLSCQYLFNQMPYGSALFLYFRYMYLGIKSC